MITIALKKVRGCPKTNHMDEIILRCRLEDLAITRHA